GDADARMFGQDLGKKLTASREGFFEQGLTLKCKKIEGNVANAVRLRFKVLQEPEVAVTLCVQRYQLAIDDGSVWQLDEGLGDVRVFFVQEIFAPRIYLRVAGILDDLKPITI